MHKTTSTIKQTIYSDGDSYFQALLADIDNAKETIDLETYIFANDSLAQKIVERLIAAAERGVKIRVLVDGAGTPNWGGTLTSRLEAAGIQTRIFHPFPWSLWQWSRSYVHSHFSLKAFYLISTMNSRNHRKVCVIDNLIAYMGSANISSVHLEREHGGRGWRDTGVKLVGTNLVTLKQAFDAAWNHTPIKERIKSFFHHVNKDPIIRLNNTRHRRRILYKNLLTRIRHCQKRIWMTNAYFVPDNILLKKLIRAAKRGVDVRVVLPHTSDIFFMPWASASFYQNLLKAGVRVFEYLPGVLHAKTLILDDWMLVGSSNLNHRSVLHDLEIDMHIVDPDAKKVIEEQFLTDIEHSQEIHAGDFEKRPLYQRYLGRLVLFIKYWI